MFLQVPNQEVGHQNKVLPNNFFESNDYVCTNIQDAKNMRLNFSKPHEIT